MYINSGGTWRKVLSAFVNSGGTWRKIKEGFVNSSGIWRKFFSSDTTIAQRVIITQSTNATTYLTTLTGTNYHWEPSPSSLSYKFEWS
ncbi:hypothetical protein EB001_23155, partial [bacterium]|nr:hypothetical protein [bacterium]